MLVIILERQGTTLEFRLRFAILQDGLPERPGGVALHGGVETDDEVIVAIGIRAEEQHLSPHQQTARSHHHPGRAVSGHHRPRSPSAGGPPFGSAPCHEHNQQEERGEGENVVCHEFRGFARVGFMDKLQAEGIPMAMEEIDEKGRGNGVGGKRHMEYRMHRHADATRQKSYDIEEEPYPGCIEQHIEGDAHQGIPPGGRVELAQFGRHKQQHIAEGHGGAEGDSGKVETGHFGDIRLMKRKGDAFRGKHIRSPQSVRPRWSCRRQWPP